MPDSRPAGDPAGDPGASARRFEHLDLSGARFRVVDLTGARFDQVDLTCAVLRGAELVNVDITGEIWNLTINGVDVGPLIDAELNRRDPDRTMMRPTDPDGFREAWRILETLRHLNFATNAWINRVLLGNSTPWHPLDLPFDQLKDNPAIPGTAKPARPSSKYWPYAMTERPR